MNQQFCEQIKRAVWNSGGGIVTDQAVQIITKMVVNECSDFIRGLYIGNFYVIADELDEHFKNST